MSEETTNFASEEKFMDAFTADGGLELFLVCEGLKKYNPECAIFFESAQKIFSAILAVTDVPLEIYVQYVISDPADPMFFLKNTGNNEGTFKLPLTADQFTTTLSILNHLFPKKDAEEVDGTEEEVEETVEATDAVEAIESD